CYWRVVRRRLHPRVRRQRQMCIRDRGTVPTRTTLTGLVPVVIGATLTRLGTVTIGATLTRLVPVVIGATLTRLVPVVIGATLTRLVPVVIGTTLTRLVPVVIGATLTRLGSIPRCTAIATRTAIAVAARSARRGIVEPRLPVRVRTSILRALAVVSAVSLLI
ncbi:hypothetical protein, partial [Microbacterium sp. AR7-10]|uniref:hypothetical protein n=1 Tax=Microbacterium sp. AR7-10 TaxID=1891970 RepID=UPI001C433118